MAPARLTDRVENALSETRMLILGAQVLLGFQYRAAFEPGFERLPFEAQLLKLAGLCLMVLAVGLLIAPGAYHQLVEGGEDVPDVTDFTGRIAALALLPFALGLGIDLFIAGQKVSGVGLGLAAGLGGAGLALCLWYGLEWLVRARTLARSPASVQLREAVAQAREDEEMQQGTPLETKIKHVLTEARVVLPGAQALLGFQFAALLTDAFDKLPPTSRYLHLVSLGMIAVAVALLMAPAAFHRIVEQGEDTSRVHRFASVMILAAMVPLALGIGGDVYVVVDKVIKAPTIALFTAGLVLAFCFGLWFGLTGVLRARRAPAAKQAQAAPAHQS